MGGNFWNLPTAFSHRKKPPFSVVTVACSPSADCVSTTARIFTSPPSGPGEEFDYEHNNEASWF